ncbi:MAG: hypothetical protein V4692_04780, partial [Bdellovibrionota bacterium]
MKLLRNTILATLILSSAGFAAAQEPEESEEATLAATLSAERAKKRIYPGGRDEQDLTVQASLPLPV